MPVPRYKKSAWNAASKAQKQFLRLVWSKLELGTPVEGTIGASKTKWMLFHDARITHRDIAILGWANHKIAQITDAPALDYPLTETVQVTVPDRIQIPALDVDGNPMSDEAGEPILRWVDDPSGATHLVDEERTLGDVSTIAAAAQGTVAWFGASDDLPTGWTPTSTGV